MSLPEVSKNDISGAKNCNNCEKFDPARYKVTNEPCAMRKRIHNGEGVCVFWSAEIE